MHSAPELQGTTTPLRSGPAPLYPGPLPENAASGPITARFQDISLKVSQNREVSPKYHQKACHSPYIQNEVQKSPLDILQISIWASLLSQGINGPF